MIDTLHRPLGRVLGGLLLGLLLPACAPTTLGGDDGRLVGPLPSLAPMLRQATPTVVNIATESITTLPRTSHPIFDDPFFRRFFADEQNQPRRTSNSGSGVIVDADRGFILTNHHVIDQAESITVTLFDGRQYPARVVGTDSESDVSVLQINAPDLRALPLADSDALAVGDYVVAIGNPYGLGQTVTSGIVSALGRSGLGIEGYEDFIQTDASINPGNSGGPLVNLRGELVGINTAILAPSGGSVGINFAIPANMVALLMEQLVRHGGVKRGLLGVVVENLTGELAQTLASQGLRGAQITQLVADSPAALSGLQVGDVITQINDRPILSASVLRTSVGILRVGETVRLVVWRNGQLLAFTLPIAPRPDP